MIYKGRPIQFIACFIPTCTCYIMYFASISHKNPLHTYGYVLMHWSTHQHFALQVKLNFNTSDCYHMLTDEH